MKICMGCMEQYDDELTICPHCGFREGTEPENAMHMETGSILKDRYIIGRVIGFGGFGVTYIAWDCLLETKVAIKEYLPSEFSTRVLGHTQVTVFSGDKEEQFNDGMVRFIEEAKKLAKYHSTPGIVKIFDSFECNNTAYIIMELLEGETLSEILKKKNTIPEDEAVRMMIPVIKSLEEVHKEGIIHRDIAPDNIFVTKNGNVKLIDFGAARYATTTHSRSLTVIIKPGYSPEEQYRSRGDQGPYTDVYAVAATLYKMITGQTPPDALERRAFYENKKKDILVPLNKYVKDIDENIEIAILNALNVRIGDRTPNMETFLQELTSETPVKRRQGTIKTIDMLTWPLWAKITVPTLAAAVVVTLVLLFSGVVEFGSDLESDIMIPEGQTKVPSVINEGFAEGEERIVSANLLLEISGKVYSEDIDEDLILNQSVNAGDVVPENTLVTVNVSSGKLLQQVPNVIGMDYDEALALLEELDFSVSVTQEYSSVIKQDCVISQSVSPYNGIEDESELNLVISKGADPAVSVGNEEIKIPDFVGVNFDEVLKKAEESGFVVKVTERSYSLKYNRDYVMSQSVKANTSVKKGALIEFTVSKGYEKSKVPDLFLRTEEKAISQLKGRGFKYKIIYEENDTVAEGKVISQSPQADTEAAPEMEVVLHISTGAKSFSIENVVGMQEDKAIDALTAKGLSVTVTYKEDNSKKEGEVLEQSVKVGTSVKRGDSVVLTVCTKSSVISVPNVVGKTQSDAEKLIKSAGLKANVIKQSSDKVAKGSVISQNPKSGTNLKKDDIVTITVSTGKDTTSSKSSSSSRSSKASDVLNSDDENDDNRTANNSTSVNKTSSSGTTTSKAASSKVTSSKAASSKVTSSKAASSKAASSKVTSSKAATVEVTGIQLDESSITLEEGKTRSLSAQISPYNATNRDVTWESSNTSVATVSSDGTVTAKKAGKTTITVSTTNGKKASCSVTVTAKVITPTSVTINVDSVNMKVGDTKRLTASVSPSNATNKTVTWSTGNSSVAVVNSSGEVTAKAAGTAVITAKTSNGKTATCKVTVSASVVNPTAVKLNVISLKLNEGETQQLTATISPSNVTNKSLSWITDNSNIATVDSNGRVTAKNAGHTTITVITSNNITDKCSIEVVAKTVEPVAVSLDITSVTMASGDTQKLNAVVSPSNASNKSLTWTSSNQNVATVNGDGVVTAIAPGTASITASTVNGKTVECVVTVTGQIGKDGTLVIESGNCGDFGYNVKWQLCESGLLYVHGDGRVVGQAISYVNEPSRIKKIIVDEGITQINGFEELDELESVELPESLTSIGDNTFQMCVKLSEINIPEKVTSIGRYAFAGCEAITDLTLERNISQIGEYAFSNCVNFESLVFRGDMPNFDSRVFFRCNVVIYYPNNNHTWDSYIPQEGSLVTLQPYD